MLLFVLIDFIYFYAGSLVVAELANMKIIKERPTFCGTWFCKIRYDVWLGCHEKCVLEKEREDAKGFGV